MGNNESERLVRNPVVGRNLFYGSGALWSGQLAATRFNIFETLICAGRRKAVSPGNSLTCCRVMT